MNVNVPDDLCEAIAAAAKWYRIPTEEAVRRALAAYVEAQRQIKAELDGWQDWRETMRSDSSSVTGRSNGRLRRRRLGELAGSRRARTDGGGVLSSSGRTSLRFRRSPSSSFR